MSRGGAENPPGHSGREGTPVWVWAVYVLGGLAAAVFAFSILFTVGAYLFSGDVPVTFDVSLPALVVWGGLVVLAAVTWARRRRR